MTPHVEILQDNEPSKGTRSYWVSSTSDSQAAEFGGSLYRFQTGEYRTNVPANYGCSIEDGEEPSEFGGDNDSAGSDS